MFTLFYGHYIYKKVETLHFMPNRIYYLGYILNDTHAHGKHPNLWSILSEVHAAECK